MLYGVKCRKRLSSHGAVNKGDNLGCINTVSTDCELSASLNCNENEKLEKVKEILRCWKYHRLTLIGKITVIKSLVVSQLVYLLLPLCSNYKVLNEISNLLYTFL